MLASWHSRGHRAGRGLEGPFSIALNHSTVHSTFSQEIAFPHRAGSGGPAASRHAPERRPLMREVIAPDFFVKACGDSPKNEYFGGRTKA